MSILTKQIASAAIGKICSIKVIRLAENVNKKNWSGLPYEGPQFSITIGLKYGLK